ncbi:MAG TPA: HEPN domain-containing protein [Chthonomonadales bacterium]|nr:HEPN domain-containing protein [Chthonomonadales bacterium]
MDIERARESLRAAQLCVQEGLVNSAASRAYYAMFQAAQVAMAAAGSPQSEWSHQGLQASFVIELIHRRKTYPAVFSDYLSYSLGLRRAADYGLAGVNRKIALSTQGSFVRRCR